MDSDEPFPLASFCAAVLSRIARGQPVNPALLDVLDHLMPGWRQVN